LSESLSNSVVVADSYALLEELSAAALVEALASIVGCATLCQESEKYVSVSFVLVVFVQKQVLA